MVLCFKTWCNYPNQVLHYIGISHDIPIPSLFPLYIISSQFYFSLCLYKTFQNQNHVSGGRTNLFENFYLNEQ